MTVITSEIRDIWYPVRRSVSPAHRYAGLKETDLAEINFKDSQLVDGMMASFSVATASP